MYLAIDIGATKVLFAVFTENGKITEQLKFPTPEEYPKFIDEIEKNINQLKEHDFKNATIAIPAKLDRKNGIAIAFGNRPWRNKHIESDLNRILKCPIQIENDAKLAALSEAINIKKDFKKVLYVTISTGISSGLIINGIIDESMQDSESGQMWFDRNGKRTQWEDFASGRAIVEKYGKRASEITDKKIWKEISQNIAIGLIELIAVIQPEVIVLGGGVGTHFSKYKKPLLEELAKYELPIIPIPPIIKAVNPEEAVVYGCYHLSKKAYEQINQRSN